MLNVVVLVSGGGSNLQALIDAQNRGELANGRLACVISSREGAYALTRAQKAGIGTQVLSPASFGSREEYGHALINLLDSLHTDLVVLAGFLSILGKEVVTRYKNRIINVHPSLIPSFCGKGFYGLRVHQAVLDYGVKITGATVHFVNEIPDGGAVLLQKAVEVADKDTPETLQRRVMEQAEWELLPRAVALFCEGRIALCGRHAHIADS